MKKIKPENSAGIMRIAILTMVISFCIACILTPIFRDVYADAAGSQGLSASSISRSMLLYAADADGNLLHDYTLRIAGTDYSDGMALVSDVQPQTLQLQVLDAQGNVVWSSELMIETAAGITSSLTVSPNQILARLNANVSYFECRITLDQGRWSAQPSKSVFLSNDGSLKTAGGTTSTAEGYLLTPGNTLILGDGTIIPVGSSIILPDGSRQEKSATDQIWSDGTEIRQDRITLPDGKIIRPNGSILYPGGQQSLKDGSIITASGIRIKDGTLYYPDGHIETFSGPRTLPDQTVIDEAGNILFQDQTILRHTDETLIISSHLTRPLSSPVLLSSPAPSATASPLYPWTATRKPTPTPTPTSEIIVYPQPIYSLIVREDGVIWQDDIHLFTQYGLSNLVYPGYTGTYVFEIRNRNHFAVSCTLSISELNRSGEEIPFVYRLSNSGQYLIGAAGDAGYVDPAAFPPVSFPVGADSSQFYTLDICWPYERGTTAQEIAANDAYDTMLAEDADRVHIIQLKVTAEQQ